MIYIATCRADFLDFQNEACFTLLEAGLTGHNLQWKANFGVLCERLILASANNEGVRQKIYYIAMTVLSETGSHLTIFAKNTIILIYLRLLFQIVFFFYIYFTF